MDNPDPEMAMNPELLNVTEHRVVDTDLYGLNGEWAVNDALTLSRATCIARPPSATRAGRTPTSCCA